MARTRRRKKRTHKPEEADPSKKNEPKTFVFRRGRHAAILHDLEQDIRRVMLPNTAVNLKESRRNTMKDFLAVAGPLGVSHFMVLSASENACYLRVCKTPRGPSLHFRIHSFSTCRDVMATQSRPRMPARAFHNAPLVVMNNLGKDEHMKLTTVMFQNLFPSINVARTSLANCGRVVLLARDPATGHLRFRHYSVAVTPSGLKKSVKTLLTRKDVPDLGEMRDMSDFVTKSGYGSESEGEDAEASRVTLAQDLGHGNVADRQSRVRLYEIGPRMELELIKVEEGLTGGKVLYHAHVVKDANEAAGQDQAHKQRQREKEARKKQQEENVRRKQEDWKQKESIKRHKRERTDQESSGKRSKPRREDRDDTNAYNDDEDDDREYFKQEVGREAEPEDRIPERRGSIRY